MDPRETPTTLRENADLRELLRMIRAVIRDGEVSELEGEFIRFWLAAHPELVTQPPLDRVVPALRALMDAEGAVGPREVSLRLESLAVRVREAEAVLGILEE